MPKNRFLLSRVKKTYSQGFINILSLISLLFLTTSLLIGTAVILKNGLSFDIRKLAFVPREEGTSYSSNSTTVPTKVTTPTKETTPVTKTIISTRTLKKDCAAQCGNDQDECYKSCIGGEEFSTAANVPSVQSIPTPEVPIEIWRAQQPTSTPFVYSNPENLGCSPCNCSGIATCPGGGQIKCTVPSSCSQKTLTIGDLYSAPTPLATQVPIEIWRAQQPTSTPVSESQIPSENIVTTGIAIVPTTNTNNLVGAGVDISNPILNWIMNLIKPTDKSIPWYIKLFSGSDQEVKNGEFKLTTEEETEDLKTILECPTNCKWGCNQSNGKCLNLNIPWNSVVIMSDVKVDKPELKIQDTKINPSYDLGDLKKGKTLCSGNYKPGEIVLWGGKVQGCSGTEGWVSLSDYGFTPEILTVKPNWLTPDSKTWQALDSLASNNNAKFDEKGNLIPSTVAKQPWCNTDSGGVPSGTVSQGGTDSGGDPKSNRSRCITDPKNPNSGIWENCSSDVNSLNYCALTIVPSWYNKEDLQKEQKLFKENNQKVFEAFNSEYSNCVNKGNSNCSEIATSSLSSQGYNTNIIEGSKSLVNAQNSLYSDYFPVYENYVNNCANNPSSLDCINLKAYLNRTLAQTGAGQYFDIKTANENFASYLYNTTANKYVQLKIEYQNNCTKDRKLLSDSQYKKCFGSGGINEQIGKIDSSDEFKYFEARANLNNCNGSTDCSYWTNQVSSLEKSESIKLLLTETNAKTKYQSILSYWQNYLQSVSNQQKEYSDLVGAAVTDNYSKLQDECAKKYGTICSSDRLKQFGNDTLVNIFNNLDPDLQVAITNQVNSYTPLNKCTEGYILGGGSYKACTCPEGYYRNYDLCLPKTGTAVTSTLSPEEKNILLASIIKNQLICDSQNGGLYQSATGLCIKEIAGQKPDIFVLGREAKSSSECVSSEEYNSVTQKCVIKQQAAIKLAVGLRGNCAEGYRDASAFSDTCVPELSKKTDTFLNRIYADNFAQNSTISNIGTIIVNPIASFFDDTLKSICTNSMISDQKSWINCKNFTTVGLLNLNNGDLEFSKGVEYGISSDKPWGENTDKVVNNWMAQSVYDLASSTDGLIPQNYHDQNFKVDVEKLKEDGFYEKVLEHTNKLIQTQARETSFGGFLKNIFNAGYVDSEEVLAVGYSWMDAYTKEIKGENSNFRPVVNYNPLFVVDDNNQVFKASEKSTPTLGSAFVEGLLKQIFGKDSAHIMYKSLTGNSNPNNIERQRDLIVGDDSNSLKTSFERLGVSFDPSIDSYESWIKNNKDENKVDVEKQKIFSISSKQVNNYLNTAREKPGYVIAPLAQNGVSVVAGVLANIFLPDKIVASVAVQVGADVVTQWVVDQTTYTVFERISDALVIAANEGEISSVWSDSATNALNDFKRQEYVMNLGTSLVFNAVGEFIGKGIADNLLAKSLIKNNEYAEAAAKGLIVNNVDEITQEMVESSSKFIGVTNKGELITFLTKEQIQEAIKFNQIVKIALIDTQVEQSSKEIAEAAINKLSRTLFTVSPKEVTQEVAESLNKNVSKQASEAFLELAEPRNYLAQGGKSPGIIWVENLINKNKPVTESIENLTIGNLKNTDVAGLANGEVLDIPKAAKQGAYLRLYDNLKNQIVYYGKASDYLGDVKLGSNILVQISDTPLIKEAGSLSVSTLKNFSEIVNIQKPNYIRAVNGVVLNSFDESFEGMSFGAKNKGLLVDIITNGRVQKGIINSAGEVEKLNILSSFVARISKNPGSIIDPDTGGITLRNIFQGKSSSEGKILVELQAHIEDLQKGSLKASNLDEVFENIEGSGKVKYITSTGQVKISDFNSIDDLNRLKSSLNKQQAIWFETGDGEEKTVRRMFVSDGAGTNSYHERILPKIDLDANSSYRLSFDGASGKLLDDINEFNRIISNFEKNSPVTGFKLRQEQIEILTAPETIRQLQAGGGKSTVVGPILGAMEKNTVQVLGDGTAAKKYAQVIGTNNAFYKSEGIETVYYDNTRNAFLKIVDNKFDPKTAEVIDVDEMWKIVNRTTGKSANGGLLIVTIDSDKAWAIIRGRLKDGDTVSELFYNISLRASSGGKEFTYIVDEIGQNINARFSVAYGNPILIKNITDRSVLQGYEKAGDLLKVSNQVLDETPALNEFRKEILANKNVNELFTVYKDVNGIKTRILIPNDVTKAGKSYADIIDQALKNSSLPDDSIVRAELTNLSSKLRQVSDENFDAINKEFSNFLQKGAMDFDGDLKLNQSAFSDLSFRKKVLETDWRELSRVPKNNFDFEYVKDKAGNKLFGQIVLRKSGGTTGEEYSDIVDKIVLQREAPGILKANAFEVDESSLKSIEDLTFTPKSSQITNKEIYQDVVEKYIGYDATPDSAASALGIRATAPSERPPLPTVFVKEVNQNEVLASGLQKMKDTGVYEGYAKSYVNIDNNIAHINTTKQMLINDENVSIVARTKYFTNEVTGESSTEYYLQRVVRNQDGTIDLQNIRSIASEEEWQKAIAEQLNTDGFDPKTFNIFYEGRGRAADFAVIPQHRNIKWTVISNDSNNMEEVLQAIKRNRVFASQTDLLDVNNIDYVKNGSWIETDIERATSYNLWLTSDNEKLVLSETTGDSLNVIDYYEKVLQNDLAKSNVESRLVRIANSQVSSLESAKEFLTANLPSSRQSYIRNYLNLLITDTQRVSAQAISNLSRTPLTGKEIAEEIYVRGNNSYISFQNTLARLSSEFNLNSGQISSLKNILGLNQDFIAKDTYFNIWESANKSVTFENPKGPSQEVRFFAETTSPESMPSGIFHSKTDPDTQKVAKVIEDQVQDTPKKIVTSNITKAIKTVTSPKTIEFIKARPKVWVNSIAGGIKVFRNYLSNTFKSKEIQEGQVDIQNVYERAKIINITAHGIEEEKGGLDNLASIMVDGIKGEAGGVFTGPLISADPTFASGPHGPYYVILATHGETLPSSESLADGSGGSVIDVSKHKAYLVPDLNSKEQLNKLLENSISEGKITVDQKNNILAKTYTYLEYLKLDETQPTAEEIKKYEDEIKRAEKIQNERNLYAREFDQKNNIQYIDGIENFSFITPKGIVFDSAGSNNNLYLRFEDQAQKGQYISLTNIDRIKGLEIKINGVLQIVDNRVDIFEGQVVEFEGFLFRFDGTDRTQSFIRAKIQVLSSSSESVDVPVDNTKIENNQKTTPFILQLLNEFIKGLQKGIKFMVDTSIKLATPEAKQKINNFINKIKKEKKIEITINFNFKIKNWWKSKDASKFVSDTLKGFDSLTQKNEGFFYSYLNAKPTGSGFRSFIRFAVSRYFLFNYPLSKTIIGLYDVLRLVRWIGVENKILPPITKVTQASRAKVTSIKQTYPWKLLTESYIKVKDFVANPKRFSQNTRDIVNKPIQLVSDLVNSTKKPDKVKNPKSVEDVKNIVQQIKNLISNPITIAKVTINQVKKVVNSSPEIVKKLTPKGNKTDQGVKKSEQTVKQEIAKQEKGKTFQTIINVGSGTGTPHHISKPGAINNPLKVGEDYYGSDSNGIIVVVDGVSSSLASNSPEGSRYVVQRMIQVLKTIQNSKWDKNLTGLENTVRGYASKINKEMLSKYPSPQSATTFVGAVIVNDKLITIKAGDSRVYLLRNSTTYELNQTKVGTEQLPIQNQPNTFGNDWFSGVSISIHNLTPSDRVIVTSDGFEKYYRNDLLKQIKGILLEKTPAEAESRFRNLVLAAEKSLGKKKDDTSAVVMFYDNQEVKTPGKTSTVTKSQQSTVVKNKSGKILLSVLLSGTLLSIAANSLFGFNPLYVPKTQFAIREPIPIVQEVDKNVLTNNYNLYESADTNFLSKDEVDELLSEAELKSIELQNVEIDTLTKVKAIEFSSNNEKSYKVSGVSNPYELIPNWYYEKILPKIVSSQDFCNDVNTCRSELKYLPIASHVGTTISLSSNYQEGLNFSRLDEKYTVNSNNKVQVRSDIKVKLENFINEAVSLDKSYYIKFIEAYRSYWNQDLAYRKSSTGDVAKPGFSQHLTGLAIDLDTNIPRDILIKVANKNGLVSPFNLNSGWSDPPHWYYLDGVFPGLTQMIIDAGYDPNDINVINQVTLGISQTYEGKIQFLNTNNSGFEVIAQNYVTYSNDKQALLSLPKVQVAEDKKVVSNPLLQLNSGNIGNVKSVKYGDSGILKPGLIIPGGVNIYSSRIKNDLFYNAISNSNIGCNSIEGCKQNFQQISPVGGTPQEVGNPVKYSSDYSPVTAGLIDINSTDLVAPADALPDDEILLPKQVVDQIIGVNKILKDQNYNFQIRIVSGYRSFENQQKYRSQRANQTSAAVEGYSQHQSSYALDITLVDDQGKNLGFSANRDKKVVDILNSYGIVHPIPQDSQHLFALDANTGINGYTQNLIKQGVDVNNYENTVKATLVAMQTYEYMLSIDKSTKNASSTDNNTGPSSVYMNASIIPFLNAEMFEKLADKYIYSKWPEAKDRGTLPVLYDAIKKFIEGKINKNNATSVTGTNNQPQNNDTQPQNLNDEKAQEITNQSDKAFNNLCSDCQEIRKQTQEGVSLAQYYFGVAEWDSERAIYFEESAKYTKDLQEKKNLVNKAKEDRESAKLNIEKALDVLNNTRKEIVNKYSMQNKCVQLYLNALVDTEEAEIRQSRHAINQAISSVYSATLVAQEIIDTQNSGNKPTMTYESKTGFLGGILGIGKETKTITLSQEELNEVLLLLNGGDKAEGNRVIGLKEMAEFERDINNKLSKKMVGGYLLSLSTSNNILNFSSSLWVPNIVENLIRQIDKKSIALSYSETISSSSLDKTLLLQYIKREGDKNAALNLIKPLKKAELGSEENELLALEIIREKADVDIAIELAGEVREGSRYSTNTISGKYLKIVLDIIKENGSEKASDRLANAINDHEIPTDLYLETLEIIFKNGSGSAAADLIFAIALNRIPEQYYTQALEFVLKKNPVGFYSNLESYLVDILLSSTIKSQNENLVWKIIDKIFSSDTFSAGLLQKLFIKKIDVGSRDRVWQIIKENAGEETANILVQGLNDRNLYDLPSDFSIQALEIIKKYADDNVTATLAREYNNLPSRIQSQALEIILDKGGESTAGILAQQIEDRKIPNLLINNVLEFIKIKGGRDSAHSLMRAIVYPKLNEEYHAKVLEIIKEKSADNCSALLARAIADNILAKNLEPQALEILSELGNEEAAGFLSIAISKNNFNEELQTKALKIINKWGGADVSIHILDVFNEGLIIGDTNLNIVAEILANNLDITNVEAISDYVFWDSENQNLLNLEKYLKNNKNLYILLNLYHYLNNDIEFKLFLTRKDFILPKLENSISIFEEKNKTKISVLIGEARKEMDKITLDYKEVKRKLAFGEKLYSDYDYKLLDLYLQEIDKQYKDSYSEIARHFSIENWQSKKRYEVLREIDQQLLTVDLNPIGYAFEFNTKDVRLEIPESVKGPLLEYLSSFYNLETDSFDYFINKYKNNSIELLVNSILEDYSAGSSQHLDEYLLTINIEDKQTISGKINSILKTNLSTEQKIDNLSSIIAASNVLTDEELATLIKELIKRADMDDLVKKLLTGKLNDEEFSLLINKLLELDHNYLSDLVLEHNVPKLRKSLEATNFWKLIKQIGLEYTNISLQKESAKKEISLVFTNRSLIDVWQGQISGTCFGDHPYFLSKRENIVAIKMVKDNEIFGNALFIIQGNKLILAGFDYSESFEKSLNEETTQSFIEKSFSGIKNIADKNHFELLIAYPNGVGGLSNRHIITNVENYILSRYIKGSAQLIDITQETALHPTYGYKPNKAYVLKEGIITQDSQGYKEIKVNSYIPKNDIERASINIADKLANEAEKLDNQICDAQAFIVKTVFAATGGTTNCPTTQKILKGLINNGITDWIRKESWQNYSGKISRYLDTNPIENMRVFSSFKELISSIKNKSTTLNNINVDKQEKSVEVLLDNNLSIVDILEGKSKIVWIREQETIENFGPVGKRYTAPFAWVSSGFNSQQVHLS